MSDPTLNEALMKAVEEHDVVGVKNCLAGGADPNYARTWGEDDTHQPTTPLRMVVFRISDNLLEDADLKLFAEIANLLLHYGADPKPAIQLAELRYGKYDPTAHQDPFTDVLRIIEQAGQ
jgi:hypothetical protein